MVKTNLTVRDRIYLKIGGAVMDQVKIGAFIAELRKENNLTQQALGDKLGVTNKTISRWETGVYMPDIEMLQLLGKEFGVSVNEIIAGERISEESFKEKAEENLISAMKSKSSFSIKERMDFFRKKWLKEHVALIVCLVLVVLAVFIVGIVNKMPLVIGGTPVLALICYAWAHNRMMIYVEGNVFDGNK